MLRRAFLFALANLILTGILTAQQFTDSVAPTAAITSPANGATIRGTIAIDADACDNIGVTKVEFFLDASQIGSDSAYPYSLSWSSKSAPNGSHSLKSKAYDAANNATTSATVSITIDPEFCFSYPKKAGTQERHLDSSKRPEILWTIFC